MANYHAPALLKTATQATVLIVFVGMFFLSIGAVQHISRRALKAQALHNVSGIPRAVIVCMFM